MLEWLTNFFKKGSVQVTAAVKALVFVAACALQLYARAYDKGYSAGADSVQAQWNLDRAKQYQKSQQHTQLTASAQRALDEQAARLTFNHLQDLQNVQADYESRMAAVRAGTHRVYVPANTAGCSASAATATTPAAYPENATRLDAATVEHLAGIARDGDTAIILLNEMIDRYNAARAALQQLEAQQQELDK